jgi:hypothetical protein
LANNDSVRDLFPGDEFPWALSLPDLDTLTDLLRTPARFLQYARQRIQVERAPFSMHGDEMDLLGLYLAGHLSIEPLEVEGYNSVMVAGLSGNVDEYIWKKHEQGLALDPPQPPILPESGKHLVQGETLAVRVHKRKRRGSLADLGRVLGGRKSLEDFVGGKSKQTKNENA